jgi:hypothetical protein
MFKRSAGLILTSARSKAIVTVRTVPSSRAIGQAFESARPESGFPRTGLLARFIEFQNNSTPRIINRVLYKGLLARYGTP